MITSGSNSPCDLPTAPRPAPAPGVNPRPPGLPGRDPAPAGPQRGLPSPWRRSRPGAAPANGRRPCGRLLSRGAWRQLPGRGPKFSLLPAGGLQVAAPALGRRGHRRPLKDAADALLSRPAAAPRRTGAGRRGQGDVASGALSENTVVLSPTPPCRRRTRRQRTGSQAVLGQPLHVVPEVGGQMLTPVLRHSETAED